MAPSKDYSLIEHLSRIEGYMRGCQLLRHPRESSPLRNELAGFLRRRLPEVLDEWVPLVCRAFSIPENEWGEIRQSIYGAMIRWVRHIEDPADVQTYRYLRNHARGGFISRFPASRFLAGQMAIRLLFRKRLIDEYGADPDKARELVGLLDQEFQERVLHITDFFVEARLEELNAQEASFRQSIDNAPAAIFQIRFDDGSVFGANRVAERVTGFPRAELIGKKVWELHPPGEHERAREDWLATRRLGHRSTDDLHLLHRSGAEIPILVNSGVIEYGKQRFVQRICVDQTERRRLESQLVQSEKMAAIGQLAAGVAHEIRNPLGAIRNALYDLREILTDAPPEAQEDVRIAEEELSRAKVIIDNLLEFSRVSNAASESVDLNDLLEKTLLLMNRFLQNNDVRVETDFADIPTCSANENEMRQVVLNLVTNAVQAMPGGGRLRLRTGVVPGRNGGGRRVLVEVSDSGVGIPAEHLKDIFNPFFTTKEPGQGTGLGLSVVDSIVRRSRGEIHVQSKVGEGTTFRLEFPCNCPETGGAVGDV
jgi:PAS domain S-box-containing protein